MILVILHVILNWIHDQKIVDNYNTLSEVILTSGQLRALRPIFPMPLVLTPWTFMGLDDHIHEMKEETHHWDHYPTLCEVCMWC